MEDDVAYQPSSSVCVVGVVPSWKIELAISGFSFQLPFGLNLKKVIHDLLAYVGFTQVKLCNKTECSAGFVNTAGLAEF
jgi:hypothetical protein